MCLYKDLSENCPNNSIFRTMLRHCRNIVLSTQMLSEERHAPNQMAKWIYLSMTSND